VEKSKFTVTRMVRLLGVSRSGFYAWLVRVPSKRAIRAERIEAKVAWFHGDSDEVSGSPKILADLRGDGEVMHTLSLHPPNRRGINRDRYTSRPSAMGRHSRGGFKPTATVSLRDEFAQNAVARVTVWWVICLVRGWGC